MFLFCTESVHVINTNIITMKLLQGLSSLFKPCPSPPTPPSAVSVPTSSPDSSNSDLKERVRLAEAMDRCRTQERAEVKRLLSTDDQSDVFVFFETKWLNAWNEYLRGGPQPGPIDFTDLMDKQGKVRKDMRVERDYRVISFDIWEYLQRKHGSEPPLVSSAEDIRTAVVLTEGNEGQETVLTEVNWERSGKALSEEEELGRSLTVRGWGGEGRCRTEGLVGLANPGFFCYMNASLQCLLSVEPFCDFFYEKRHQQVHNRIPKPYSEALSDIITAVFSSERGSYRPSRLWSLCQRRFPALKMHDAQEFLHFLLDSLDTELACKGKSASKEGLIACTFMGVLRSNVRCMECGRGSRVDEGFLELSVPLAESVKKAFRMFTAAEVITDEYECEYCDDQTSASKQIAVLKAPRFLLLSIKRFREFPYPQKTSSHIKFHKRIEVAR